MPLSVIFCLSSDECFQGNYKLMMRCIVTVLVVIQTWFHISLREAGAGPIYDMSTILSQPHPFDTPAVNDPTNRPLTMPSTPIEGQGYVQPIPVNGSPIYVAPLPQPNKKSHDDTGVWRFEIQNEDALHVDIFEQPMDKFFNEKVQSGHLTWGWRFSYTPNAPNPDWLDKFREDLFWSSEPWKARVSYSLQQSAYTPNTYTSSGSRAIDGLSAIPDRPSAGYLLANARFNLEQDFKENAQYLDRVNIGLGVVGPLSGGEEMHKIFHRSTSRNFRSWDELDTEPVAILQYDTGKRWVWEENTLGFGIEFYPYTGVTLGNAYTYASLGVSSRIGTNLREDSGPLRSNMIMSGTNFPQTGDYLSWNLFAGIEGKYVGHNIFVDGNSFSNTSDVSSLNKVLDVQLGGEIGWGEKRVSLMHVFRTEEFASQISPDKFLRVGLSSDFSKFDFKNAKSKKGPISDVISEVRMGLLSHDIKFPNRKKFRAPNPFENRYESGVNINPEVVFISPGFLDVLWAPRPHVGVSLNMDDDTNYAYTGLSWNTSWTNDIFLDGFWGLAVHDGKLTDGNPDKIEFGSKMLFRLGGELGWRWDGHNGISLIWEHMSNAGVIDDKNQGIDSLGIRYSYSFN